MWISRVTCKYTTSAFPSYKHSQEGDTTQFHPASYTDILLIPRPTEGRRLSWPGWLTHSGRLTHEVVTRQPWIRSRSGKVRRLQTDVLTTEPRHPTFIKGLYNYRQLSVSLLCFMGSRNTDRLSKENCYRLNQSKKRSLVGCMCG